MLVMVGGGHTHALVLKKWIEEPATRPEGKILLVSQHTTTPYGGMLSSVIQKRLPEIKMMIPIQHLCSRANVEFMQDVAIGLSLATKEVWLGFRVGVNYDVLSINSGGFVPRFSPRSWRTWIEKLERSGQEIVIIGAGLSGVETALAMRVRFPDRHVKVVEVGSEILPEVAPRLRRKIAAMLTERKIDVHLNTQAETGTSDQIIINCSATRAPRWMRVSGLECNGDLLSVRPTLQTSDDRIFATGACAQLVKSSVARAPVYPEREAPVLATNLQKAVAGKMQFSRLNQTRRKTVLMPVDHSRAMLLRGGFSLGPAAFWMRMKDRIDQRFVTSLERMAE